MFIGVYLLYPKIRFRIISRSSMIQPFQLVSYRTQSISPNHAYLPIINQIGIIPGAHNVPVLPIHLTDLLRPRVFDRYEMYMLLLEQRRLAL